MFDWPGLEEALFDALLPPLLDGGPYRAAALSELYAETDGIITAPLLYLNDDGKDMDSPPDWETCFDEWTPSPWIESLTAEACSGTVAHWEETFTRYQDLLARICFAAGGRVGFPVFFIEHSRYEEILGRCLTPAQLQSLFPEVVATQAERARVAALPLDDQVTYYVSRLDRFGGLIDSEEAQKALRGLGPVAIPALLPLLRKRNQTWLAAKLLAEIGVASPAVTDALSAAIGQSTPDSPGQLWSCRALARLNRFDLVLAQTPRLSQEALATAAAAPYTAFRDLGPHPSPLDYSLLSSYADSLPAIEKELAPGSSYCVITAAEVPEAMRGTTSPHSLIRKHAVCVLGSRHLGEEVGRQVIPLLRTIAGSDPDSEVRRLAALSLEWWKALERSSAGYPRAVNAQVPLLWLCGPSGVGKSTVGWEIFSQLPRAAFVDADQLGLCYPSPADDPYNHRLKARNLGAIWSCLRAAGAESVVLAGGIEVAEQINLYAGQVPEAALTVCRLRAGHATLRDRFIRRGWMSHLADVAVAEVDELDRLDFGDLCVSTDGLTIAEVARVVRDRAGGWPASASTLAAPAALAPAPTPVSSGPVPMLLLCGTTAVGKSTVGYQVFTRVRAEAKAAYVDLAQIGFCRPAPADDPGNHRLKAANLAAMWPAFRDAGARCLIVTGRVNDAAAIRTYAEALPAMDLTVCRLHAGRDALTDRILRRGRGEGPAILGDELKGRTAAELHQVAEQAAREAGQLQLAQVGDLSFDTDDRSVEDVAQLIAAEMVAKL